MGDAIDRALAADRPCVAEAFSDPDVPTPPPHVTLGQARHFTGTFLKGDSHEAGIFAQWVKSVVTTLLPHRK